MTGEEVIQFEEDNADPNIHLPAPSYWPMVLAFALPVMAYGVIYNTLLIVAGGAIATMAMFGWALEPADAEASDFDPPVEGDETSKELPMSDSLISETVKDAVQIVKDHNGDVHEHDVHAGDDHSGDHGGHHTSLGLSNTKLAMWLFLGSECLLFGGLISTYMLYRNRHSENLGPDQLWDIPFTSATSFVLSRRHSRWCWRCRQRTARTFVIRRSTSVSRRCSVPCSWRVKFTSSRSFTARAWGSPRACSRRAFFTLTGFHGVHVSIGIIMLVAMIGMLSKEKVSGDEAEAVEMVGLYWHFVDIVWIIIFTLVYLIPA